MMKEEESKNEESEDDLDTLCVICFEIFQPPILLDCGHSFCKRCCEGMSILCQKEVSLLVCPLCRCITPWSSFRPLVVNQTLKEEVQAKVEQRNSEVVTRSLSVPEDLTNAVMLLMCKPSADDAQPECLYQLLRESLRTIFKQTQTQCVARYDPGTKGKTKHFNVRLDKELELPPASEGTKTPLLNLAAKPHPKKGACTYLSSATLVLTGKRTDVRSALCRISQALSNFSASSHRRKRCACLRVCTLFRSPRRWLCCGSG